MRSAFGSKNLALGALAALCISFSTIGVAYAADPAKELPPDREEIIITHERLGPLSDWAAMQQHSAEYARLKAKFDPSAGSSHTDNWTSDRALAGPAQTGGGFAEESANAPTPSAIRAAEDLAAPP